MKDLFSSKMYDRIFGQEPRTKSTTLIKPKSPLIPKELEIMVTLLPSFSHFGKFINDTRLAGIRLNSAMLTTFDLDKQLALIPQGVKVPLYFDIKGRQLRVTKVIDDPNALAFELNHPIRVNVPTPVLFKAGADSGFLTNLGDGKQWYGSPEAPLPGDGWFHQLAFPGNCRPYNDVRVGESLHIRDASLRVGGNQFTDLELEKIQKVKKHGIVRWFLSYVQSQRDVDEFLDLVGKHEEVVLKIESKQGMEYVAREFKKRDNLRLCAAKGDLYVELDMPHEILKAQKLIIEKDPYAIAGSRMMLSVVNKVPSIVDGVIKYSIGINEVPSDADFEQLAWLYEIGYRNFMLCDELCLRDNLLTAATNAVAAFKDYYTR